MELITERLKLKLLTPDIIGKIQQDLTPEDQMNYLGLGSLEELAIELAKFNARKDETSLTFRWFLLLLHDADKIIGSCGYHTWYRMHDRAEIGYKLYVDEFKNKGYMREAIAAVIDYGFNDMNLHRIEALVGPTNEPSLKLMQQYGFVQEGYLKEHYKRDGIYEDSIMFGLIMNK